MKYDSATADCAVYAFKEGVLAAVGHDVKLVVGRFEIEVDEDRVRATFHADSVKAVCAMKDGREDHAALSEADRATIDGYVRNDILHARRYPTITFVSHEIEAEDDAWLVEGELTLHGSTRRLQARVEALGDRLRARVTVRQPDFGIPPFRALLGALKIQPQVEVEISVPRGAW